jgi:hypothetical protein
MVMMKGLFMEKLFVVVQRPSNSLDSVTRDMFQFRSLKLVHKYLNAIQKGCCFNELLPCECAIHMTQVPSHDPMADQTSEPYPVGEKGIRGL